MKSKSAHVDDCVPVVAEWLYKEEWGTSASGRGPVYLVPPFPVPRRRSNTELGPG